MVYCGKPSQACGPCRAKKTRCDKARPSCSQCVRTKTQCEGYRDDGDTLFRNQTDAVISKAQQQQQQQQQTTTTTARADHKALVRAQRSPSTSTTASTVDEYLRSNKAMMPWMVGLLPGSKSSSSSTASSSSSPPPSLSVDVDDLANMTFYKQFLANGLAPGRDGFGLVPSVYTAAPASSGLQQLMTALGLASHPELRRDADVQQLARRRYARALALTNRALGDAAARLRDDTLMTVILLAMYELVTGADAQSIKSWTAHVNGATDLLVMRGERQLRSPAGVAMFTHMRSRIYISCIQRHVPIPEPLLRLSRACFAYQTGDEAWAAGLLDIVADYGQLQYDIVTGALPDSDDACRRLYAVDARQRAWIEQAPAFYRRTRVFDRENEFAYDGYYDLYSSKFVALIRNNASVLRVISGQLLRRILRQHPHRPGVEREIDAVSETIRHESGEMCANLPFLMGDVKPLNGEEQVAPNLYGYSNLAWILYPVISDGCGNPKMQQWCFQLLLRVSETAGLQQTKTLAMMAREDADTEDYIERRETFFEGAPLAQLSLRDKHRRFDAPTPPPIPPSPSPSLPAETVEWSDPNTFFAFMTYAG